MQSSSCCLQRADHGILTGNKAEEEEEGDWWSFLRGRVVVLQVREDMTVCKRVVGISSSPAVRAAWEDVHFPRPVELEEGGIPVFSRAAAVDGPTSLCDGPSSSDPQADAAALHSLAQDGDEALLRGPPLASPPSFSVDDDERSRGAIEAAGLELEAEQRGVGEGRRSSWWDWCVDKATPATEAWVWVEGDNPADSFDSRHVGALPLDCVGRIAVAKLWRSPAIL
jgi:hypothetical protein